MSGAILRPGYASTSQFGQTPDYSPPRHYSNSPSSPIPLSYDLESMIKSLNLPIDAGTQDYLSSVLFTMFQTLALATAAMGVAMYSNSHVWNRYGTAFAIVNFIAFAWLVIFSSPHQKFLNISLQKILLATVGITTGLSLKQVIEMVADVQPALPFVALLCTSVAFLSLTYFSLKQSRGYLIGLYGSFAAILSLASMYGLISMLFGVNVLPHFIWSILGVAICSFHVIFDIQNIVHGYQNARHSGEAPSVEKDAAMLFVNFVKLFVRILQILQSLSSDKKDEERKRNRRREL